jgi:hypothetical protein
MQLFCVLLITFPPSKNFKTYLYSYMQQKTTQQEGRVDVMAKYCLRRLVVITKKGNRLPSPKSRLLRLVPTYCRRPNLSTEFSLLGCCQPPIPIRRCRGPNRQQRRDTDRFGHEQREDGSTQQAARASAARRPSSPDIRPDGSHARYPE